MPQQVAPHRPNPTDRLDTLTCAGESFAGFTTVTFKWDGKGYDAFISYQSRFGGEPMLVVMRGLKKSAAERIAERHCGQQFHWSVKPK